MTEEGGGKDLLPFAACLQGLAVGSVSGAIWGAEHGWLAVGAVGVAAVVIGMVGYVVEKRERRGDGA